MTAEAPDVPVTAPLVLPREAWAEFPTEYREYLIARHGAVRFDNEDGTYEEITTP